MSVSVCVCVSFISKEGMENGKEKGETNGANGEKEWQLNQNAIFNSSMAMLSPHFSSKTGYEFV